MGRKEFLLMGKIYLFPRKYSHQYILKLRSHEHTVEHSSATGQSCARLYEYIGKIVTLGLIDGIQKRSHMNLALCFKNPSMKGLQSSDCRISLHTKGDEAMVRSTVI